MSTQMALQIVALQDELEQLKGIATRQEQEIAKCHEVMESATEKLASVKDMYMDLGGKYAELMNLYNDLIMMVESKHPSETRHQTAKRHIANAEIRKPAAVNIADASRK